MQTNTKERQQLLLPTNVFVMLMRFSYFLLIATLFACNSTNSQSGMPSGSLQIDIAATVPVLANKATTTVIYVHNTSDNKIDNISYNVANDNAKSISNEFTLNQKSCNSIPAHSACALEFTTPQLSAKDGNVQGSALIQANFMQNGKVSYSQQFINYTLLPVEDGLNVSSDITLQANQYGTIYLYAESGSYNLQATHSNNPQISENTRSSKTLNSPQVVALELSAGDINQSQNIRLDLNYQNQTTKNFANSQFSVDAIPTINGAILTSGQMPILNTTQSTSGQMLIYNSGNQSAALGNINGTNNISIVDTGSNRCIANSTNLAAGDSCIVYFTVPQAGNSGTITVSYSSSQLVQSVTWYNSINEALLQMIASPSTVSFNQSATSSPVMITAINIGGYNLTGITIPTATNPNGGSATTIMSKSLSCRDSSNSPTGTNLPVGGSCSYAVKLSDSTSEANKNMLLKIGGNYTTSSGASQYQRSTAISYTVTDSVSVSNFMLVGFAGIINQLKFNPTAEYTNVQPPAVNLKSVINANGMFVTVASYGTILISSDGTSWSGVSSGITDQLNGIAYGGDMFIAVGDNGTILTSSDGISWSSASSGTSGQLNGITYGGGMFIAIGNNGTILASSDGISWSSASSGTSGQLNGITYGDGMFIAVGDNGTILTSSDGISWSSASSGTSGQLNGITYGGGMFIAIGNNGMILTSGDGISWSSASSGTSSQLNGITYGDGKFVAIGNNGTILTSSDGISWSSASSGTSSQLNGITYGDGKFVAVGSATLTSNDGTSWNDVSFGAYNMLYSIVYGGGKFVAVGDSGTILVSSDGSSWSNVSFRTYNMLDRIAYGGGKFVVVGQNGTILISSDGSSWSSVSSGTSSQLNGITYSGGKFVAVGASGTVLTSSDGINWSSVSSGTSSQLNSIAYGSGKFVAVGENGTILISSDGSSWSSVTSGNTGYLDGIAYGGGKFVAVGYSGTILTSSDGSSWNSVSSGTAHYLYDIGYGGGMFVAVGDSGTILTSSDGTSWTSLAIIMNGLSLFGVVSY